MLWENQISNWASELRSHSSIPLRVDLWNGKQVHFSEMKPEVIVRLPKMAALSCLLDASLFKLGTAYVEGTIEVDGSADALIAVANRLAASRLQSNGKLLRLTRSLLRNKEREKAAIEYHYDVSNAFYQQWLDEDMSYSCAYFETGSEDLETAQQKKIDHILRKIQLRAGDRLLDVGCGWGALLIRAAQQYDVQCVGITLSENQAMLARERIARAGLSGRIDIRLQDYRDVEGSFDKITSIGMFEHVGLDNLPAYFQKMHSLLADGGIIMNHGITSTDYDNGETPFGNGDFIEKYVFPYGQLPHLSTAIRSMQIAGLEVYDIENLRRHYVKTCMLWLHRFEAHAQDIIRIVGDRRYRIWRVYLAGCRYAFEQDWISLYQLVAMKSGKHPQQFPWSREYMYFN
jgi:cyclopropane-fatty-acyl-phospholipid synthase